MPSTYPWSRALVTGASGGIGEAIGRRLAAAGVDLVVVARTTEKLKELARELGDHHGVDVEVLAADLTDVPDRAVVEERLRAADRPVDLLVNNAGYGTNGPFVELDLETEENEIDLNVVALVRLTHAALGAMRTRAKGTILNVSSLGSFQPVPSMATYGATKAFVTSFSEALHEELRGTGITVTAVCPGFIRTDFQQRAGAEDTTVPEFLWMAPQPVAEAALAAAARGDALVIPGALYKALGAISSALPRGLVRRAVGITSRRVQ